jgi:hypothetical protein
MATQTLDLYIQQGSDDAYQSGTAMNITNTSVANELDATNEYAGMRFGTETLAGSFDGVDIAQGLTITAAYLTVQVTLSTTDEPDVLIYGQAADNPGTFTTTNNDISGRTPTTATVAWSNADLGLSANTDAQSPSLVAIIQEIVDRGGWAAGNALVLIMQGSATATRDFRFNLFETSQAAAPRLHIEYDDGVGTGSPHYYYAQQQGAV